jgi:GNAT superfamily N-acetyltransferase
VTSESTTIRRASVDDVDAVIGAAVFDGPARRDWTVDFLTRRGHHLFLASIDCDVVGFVSGIEVAHPDKAQEMLLYELGVEAPFRRRGIGAALVAALRDHAVALGCWGMWVPTDRASKAAIATYRAAGANEPEAGVVLTWTFAST